MKNTKILLAVIATFMITWFFVSLVGYMISDLSLKECARHEGTIMIMLIAGWIPSVFVAVDLDEKY